MPKELTHFKIAERTADLLADTRLTACLRNRRDGLLLGAVLHDTAFYGVTPGCRLVQNFGNILHGAGSRDTFTPIRLLARHAQTTKDKDLPTALLVGMISHLFADAIFHPMIWHLSGDYYARDKKARSKAQQHHRALESLLDMVACPEMINQSRYSLRLQLKRCNDLYDAGLPVAEFAKLVKIQPNELIDGMTRSWRIYALMQSVYATRPLAGSLFGLFPYLPNSIAEIAALFYAPQLLRQADLFTGNIHFIDPLTGENHNTTLDDMIKKAAEMTSTMCRELETAIFDGSILNIPDTGPSMDAGLSGEAAPSTAYFANPPLPRLK